MNKFVDDAQVRRLDPIRFTWTAPDGYHPALRGWAHHPTGEVAEWSKARPC